MFLADSIICSGETVYETNKAKIRTAIIGNKEAIVTTPKPDKDESPFPAALAMPMPKDNTNGTVTGPVVTAPQSQAKPKIDLKFGSNHAKIVKTITGAIVKYIRGFNDQPLTNLIVPIIAAKPTPAPIAPPAIEPSLQLFSFFFVFTILRFLFFFFFFFFFYS